MDEQKHDRYLPMRLEWDELFQTLKLKEILQTRFKGLEDREFDDICQSLYVEIAEKIATGVPFVQSNLSAYANWLVKLRGIDWIRCKRENQLFNIDHQQDDSTEIVEIPDPNAKTPSTEALEAEGIERKKVTLAEVFEHYCHECERKSNMLKGKQILERTLRGQSVSEIATDMGIPEPHIHSALSRGLNHLLPLIRVFDKNGSILTTLARDLRIDSPEGNRKPNRLGTYVQEYEVIRQYLLEESGVFCPLPDRLAKFADHPGKENLDDIRYHISTGCRICQADLQDLQPDS